MALRVAMLAPISWRVPPRHYGPWEQFVSLLTEGLVARGVDVTLFATADSQTGARLVGSAPTGYSEDPALDAKVWEALHISAVFERAAEFDLIHNSFDFLPLSYSALVETPVVTTIHGFSSRADRARVTRSTTADGTTSRSATPTGTRGSTTWPRSTTGSTCSGSSSGAATAGTCSSSGGSIPTRARSRRCGSRGAAGMPLVIAGIVQDRDYFERARRAADRRRARAVRRAGRGRRPERAARRGAGAAAPRQLRGAVRIQRRRGDGLRDAGDRDRARVDAGDRPRTARTASSSRRRPRRSRRSRRPEARPRRRASLRRASLRRRPDGRRVRRRLRADR